MVDEEKKEGIKTVLLDANAIFDQEVLDHLGISNEEADSVQVSMLLEKGKYGNYISIWKTGS
ncbi:MAG: hypothetical protein N2V78_09270 [Methanophagales archaeon]|nr:hypothetical protein [Methanophagales archaeon]